MAYDAYKIMTDAYFFANTMLNLNEPLSVDKIRTLTSDDVLASKYGKILMENLILGAVGAYHEQLREELLKQNIDIGDFNYEE